MVMNAKEALQEIKKLLFNEAAVVETKKFTESKLEDGTVIKWDVESGEVWVVGEDGADVPAPIGEHKLETGEVIVVVEEGKISEVKESEKEVEVEAAAKEEVNLQEIFEERFAALEAKIEELSKKLEGADVEAEKMRDAIKLSAQVLEVLASEPSAEPIQKPVSYAKEIKNEKTDKFNRLQKAFQNLKNK